MKVVATLSALLLCCVSLSLAQTSGGNNPPPKVNAPAAAPAKPLPGETSASAESGDDSLHLWDVLQKGGWAMFPLGGLSVISGMLILGYAITLRRGAIVSRQYVSTVEVLIRKKDYLGVLAVSNRHNEALARVIHRTLDFATKNPGAPFDSLKEVAEAEGAAQASSMQHRVAYLADIGILAPMVGLFGTVLGIIRSFAAIGKGGSSLSRDILLASGVSEALVATAAGLILAVLAAGFYAIFRNRVQSLISDLDGACSTFLGLLAANYHRRKETDRGDDEF
jgi:biopolymer transport protein ExbB